MPDKTRDGYSYESEDDDGDDPCESCGHDPCWCGEPYWNEDEEDKDD